MTDETTKPITKKEKLSYGVGGYAENFMQNSVGNMANPFFNIALGLSPALIGVATFIFRIWDAFTDPIMGNISDRTTSRFGKRRPYIVVGSILAGVFYTLVWMCPEGQSEQFYFLWFTICSLLFFTAFTIFGVPYLALGYEISKDKKERTELMAYRTFFASVAGISIQWLYWFTQRDFFDGTVDAMQKMGFILGGILILFGIAPAYFSKEKAVAPVTEALKEKHKVKISDTFGVLKIKPYLILLGALTMAILGLFTVGILGVYMNIYYIYGGDESSASFMIGLGGSVYHVCSMLSIPLVTWVANRIGKIRTLTIFLSIAVLGSISKWWLATPDAPYLQLVIVLFLAPGLSSIWIFLSALVSDISNLDESKHGQSRAGSFSALYAWTMKLGFALCFAIAGFLLEFIGFDAALKADQSEQTIFLMRLLFAVVPAIGLALSIVMLQFYRKSYAAFEAQH